MAAASCNNGEAAVAAALRLAERMKQLLASGNDVDVHFLVGTDDNKELFAAHKCILNSASPVFEAMFRFDNTQTQQQNNSNSQSQKTTKGRTKKDQNQQELSTSSTSEAPILVPDVEADAFRLMLNFIYTEDTGGLSVNNVFPVLYSARKYALDRLIKACADFTEFIKLDGGNVLIVLGQARFFVEEGLCRRCFSFIDQNVAAVFASKEFLLIDQELLCELLSRDQLVVLHVHEIVIWNAALRWVDAQCVRNARECSAANRREMLGQALFQIRFPLMAQHTFAQHIVPSGLLTNEQVISVMLYYIHPARGLPDQYPLQFSTERRRPK